VDLLDLKKQDLKDLVLAGKIAHLTLDKLEKFGKQSVEKS